MKTKKYILYALSFLTLIGSSCSDTWDNHYAQEQSAVNNDQITIVNKPLTEYLAEESSLTNMDQLFKETGMIDEMQKKEQMYTILATEADLAPTRAASNDDVYTAQTYISDASISPSKITDGQRLLMWSGKFLNIKKTEEETGNIIQFNNATVTKIVKLTNGYLYILDQAIVSPRSMYEINILKGDMSIVGNRPLPLYEAELLTSDEHIDRFMGPAGLTGLWQVEKRGEAGKLSAEERKQLDITYAKTFSFWLDIKIILKTVTAFIQKENV